MRFAANHLVVAPACLGATLAVVCLCGVTVAVEPSPLLGDPSGAVRSDDIHAVWPGIPPDELGHYKPISRIPAPAKRIPAPIERIYAPVIRQPLQLEQLRDEEPSSHGLVDDPIIDFSSATFEPLEGPFRVASYQDVPPMPQQPLPPEQPLPPFPGGMQLAWSAPAADYDAMLDDLGIPRIGQVADPMGATASPSVAGVIANSSDVQSVSVQHRSPISLDPNIRGFKLGQVYSQVNGVHWLPVRQDLDSMLSKIDPGMVRSAVVVPGPYTVKYGPGFSFIDIEREPTPRYKNGSETHFRTSGNVRTNGGQFYGRETVFGGGSNYGFRLSYGHRRGSDYHSGDDLAIPSSYENRDLWGEFGFDVNPHRRVEFTYQRLDQTDTEYPGQFFDVNFLTTYGFELRLIDEDPCAVWTKLSIDTWYNRTQFAGDTSGKRLPHFPVITRIESALDNELGNNPGTSTLNGTTDGGLSSAGARVAATFGESDAANLQAGADFRYLRQNLQENFTLTNFPAFRTNMPRSWLADPGVYAELRLPITGRWLTSLGARGDFVSTTARASDVRGNTMLPGGTDDLKQDDMLYAFYLTNEFELNPCWTLRLDAGHAQRAPTLIERYADGMFLGVMQSGFSRVIGNPSLKKERNWQIDLGVEADFDSWRARAGFFHSWVTDYITFEDDRVVDFGDARLLRYTNTSFATLTGFELAADVELLPCLSLFGTMRYVQGQDGEIDAPLPSIPPLDSTIGLRLHDMNGGRRWGIECAARIVDTQDRLGTIRLLGAPTVVEEQTPGFNVWHLHGYFNCTKRLRLVAGIDNLFDTNYQEHLDLRLLGPVGFGPATRVYAPGLTPYVGVDWLF